MSLPDALGYLAALLVLATFCMHGMAALRAVAIASNVAFIGYAALAGIQPVLLLHAVLLPMNVWRLAEAWRADAARPCRSPTAVGFAIGPRRLVFSAGAAPRHRLPTNRSFNIMGIFNDMATALENYPDDEVVITITDVALQSGTAGSININEVWKFKVNVENTGHINMTGVSLHVDGVNGASVSTAPAGPFSTGTLTTGSLTVFGGGSQKSNYLYFKAPSTQKAAGTDLVTAHIADFSGNFDHMFSNHTNHALTPQAVYEAQVFP